MSIHQSPLAEEATMYTEQAQVSELAESDIRSILARNTIGRLAFVRGDQIDVLPIQYVYHAGALYGRTSSGGKLLAVDPVGTRVAFEVDEIDSARHWRRPTRNGSSPSTSSEGFTGPRSARLIPARIAPRSSGSESIAPPAGLSDSHPVSFNRPDR
jgi:hypothetical protein